jgi:ParB family transcriptional regulator, chromosome partitioning protein
MTDTITAESTHDTDAIGTLEHLDPTTLVVDTNVRDDADLDADFIASISEHGVLQPIAAVRAADGQTLVRAGQRRTLAARAAGLATVPVYVRPLAPGDDLVERVTEQIVENDQRRELTESQRARGIQQLLDAGVSVTKVAKKLSVKKDTVKAAETVGKSDAARTALDTGQLSLAEAAALTEFESLPGALDRLTHAAGTGRFDHVVAQLREEQISWQAQIKAESQWRDKGFAILDEQPRWDAACVELRYLRTADDATVDESVVTDPAQWAVYVQEEEAWVDAETGEMVDESTIDWDTENNPDADAGKGMRHFNTVTDGVVFVPTFHCLDYAAAGFTLDAWFSRNAGLSTPADGQDGNAVDLDGQDDAEARAAARAQAEADAQRRERRKVIALNRLGDAAMEVRRDFVSKLLLRKTAPKGAAIFVADCLTREPALISDYHGAHTTGELLGTTGGATVHSLVTDLPPTGDARAQVLTLGVVLGALEARTPKDSWRFGGGSGYGNSVRATDYLSFLAANGYQLADVERVIIGELSADDVYEGTLSTPEQEDTEPTPEDAPETAA